MFIEKFRLFRLMLLASFSRKEKRILLAISLCAFLLRVPLLFRSDRAIAAFPYGDDAFYLFSVAAHLAKGLGPSVDGIHWTSGFQPLILLLYTPLFALLTPWNAVRCSLLLSGLIAAAFVWAIALLVRTIERAPGPGTDRSPMIAAAIWAFSYPCFLQMTNGLETGLASLLLVIALILYVRNYGNDGERHPSVLRAVPLGIVLGLAVLARIDIAIFVLIIVGMLMWQKKFREAIVTGVIALAISLPWWIFNLRFFGSLMPESGQAENIWPVPPHENIYRATQAVSDILSLVFYVPNSLGFPVRIIWLALLVAGILFLGIRWNLFETAAKKFRLPALYPLLLFSVAVLLYYTMFFRAPHFMGRYFQPLRILWSVLLSFAVAILWKRRSLRILVGIFAIIAVVFFADRMAHNALSAGESDFYDTGVWASEHSREKIGMLQSGVASFIAPNVINLDGKVNEDALRAHQQGQLATYLRRQEFTYIADEKPFIEDIARIARTDGVLFDSVGRIGRIQLMKRRAGTP